MKYKEKYMISVPFYYERDYYNMKLAEDYRFDDLNKYSRVDIGAENKEEAEKMVSVGDPVSFRPNYRRVGENRIFSSMARYFSYSP